MIFIFILSLLLISGCGMTDLETSKGEFVCLDRGGVHLYTVGGSPICNDGTFQDNKDVVLPKEYWLNQGE